MTLMGCTDQRGGVTSAISTALMPKAHTSTYITLNQLFTCLLLLLQYCLNWASFILFGILLVSFPTWVNPFTTSDKAILV